MGNGEWVEEDQLDVEHDEDHGDEEEPDRETLWRVLGRLDTALVCGVLLIVWSVRSEKLVHRKADRSEQNAEDTEADEGEILHD